ncbi:Set1 complex component swd1 [Schizosaccharomyces pombe]|uniref:Set1 complex component swd1 n=1 Tax=Schizosaccharomyces pombe (strain 972 / ATCC 24843) TaxID=284812 RepID=SWD1_SCHPO|nr:Set1C complex subunit Swd1 [Schizosaccharomyces pombe]O42858.2 RecName: Full=Set1 complex component swd1; Short=Set1C component swd1; AltName: Full=COMPASS component swd1; AltName: Full=Complex proteins associated with set1 protein swd1 [Schizosaccharomyces pombe 972h-]CAB16241.2 Set1C complex subunit Swd1 [Schizosaccharomyces pombe]|eukprot:NP_593795.1 Set1C complex subunit Swd1 [Schizosaccharomyces pombe]
MNLELLDPFSIPDYPEALTTTLKHGHATSIRFSTNGYHLASGLVNGSVVIWDLSTFSVSRVLTGHTRAIQSVCWSSCDRFLLTASRDWKCILWDLRDGSIVYQVVLSAPVWSASLHPHKINTFVASLLDESPQLIIVDDGIPKHKYLPTNPDIDENYSDRRNRSKHVTLVSFFHPSGEYILSGTSKGWFHVIDASTTKIRSSHRITSQSIKQIRLSFCKRFLIFNSTDRVIRTVSIQDLDNPEVEHKFQDVVNRLQWNSCGFSQTGEFVFATTYQMAHAIYVWERGMGSLVKILEGPKEELVDVDWHPVFPCVASVGLDSGSIYIWAVEQKESWSAFAPDFQELEENIEYEEPEDEFDIHDETGKSEEEEYFTSVVKILPHDSSAEQPFVMPPTLSSS